MRAMAPRAFSTSATKNTETSSSRGALDAPVPREDDDRGERDLRLQGPEEAEPVEPGHHEIGDDHGRGRGDGLVERLLPVGSLLHVVAPRAEQRAEPLAGGRLIVDDENPVRHGSSWIAPW
ncbi:MAG: hypothetical protein A3K12_06820 [Candidatus Rokubacteria bacterium RIFCSPLOWO2_12_FULL_71_19]|nr:MAG: hypothetical protein A3K12_06820 [Candidatus Rokubacteria bacterium RIFCSPLOWO2_12_FULL_71_19]